MTEPIPIQQQSRRASDGQVVVRVGVAEAHREQVASARGSLVGSYSLRSVQRGALELVGTQFLPKQCRVELAVSQGSQDVARGLFGAVRRVSLLGVEPTYGLAVQLEAGDPDVLARLMLSTSLFSLPERSESRLPGAAALPGWASLLVDHGLISEAELRRCAQDARTKGLDLLEVLGDLVPPEDLAICQALDQGVPYVDPRGFRLFEGNASLVPRDVVVKQEVVPLFDTGGVLTLGMKDPTDLALVDQVRLRTKRQVDPCLCSPGVLSGVINQIYRAEPAAATPSRRSPMRRERASDVEGNSSEAAKLVRTLVEKAAARGASDIHLEPERQHLRVRLRIDGVLHELVRLPIERHAALTSRIKVQSKLDIAETRRPQDGHFDLVLGGREIDVRVSTLPTIQGENVVLRMVSSSTEAIGLEQLELPERIRSGLERHLAAPNGMLLVSGPTGSGKTTTLYAGLERLNTIHRSIVTIEDPVERRVELLRQIQVNQRVGLTFASGLRSILRQDPDVIMVGEIRDEETAEIAVQAALTGHLVLSTLHTNTASGAIVRLCEMGIAPFLLTSSLRAVIGQRLVRRICESCAREVSPDSNLLAGLGLTGKQDLRTLVGSGCASCMNTGYRGRIGVYEMVEITDALSQAILSGASRDVIEREGARASGGSLLEAGIERVRAGHTTLEEVARIVGLSA